MKVLTTFAAIFAFVGTSIQAGLGVHGLRHEYDETRTALEADLGVDATFFDCLRDKRTRPSELNLIAWVLLAVGSLFGVFVALGVAA